ncbi:dihydrofolate reductase [Anaerococcus lactolyticus]|uniref:dihydrofolate reductase n=1 Tax=Anaerococcus lactolyticus S7-1-13 TaxID=1284686 RepID=A0A095X0K3_9FIRM|nr:dihydrofolate reductase [Anaerococcus lactolyticus]KGF03605.1 dihydrofolate reductase [Anaerococcus lactolyticus S7-1-13]
MKLILAVDKNWAIGRDNKMLYNLKKDLNHFKETTTGGLVIMGRKTFDSIGFALPKRENIILTRDESLKRKGALVFNNVSDVINYVNKSPKEAFVIGGAEICELLLDHIDEAIITKINADRQADTFLHNFDKDNNFKPVEESEPIDDNGIKIKFVRYKRKENK